MRFLVMEGTNNRLLRGEEKEATPKELMLRP